MDIRFFNDFTVVVTQELSEFVPCKILVVTTEMIAKKYPTVLQKMASIFPRLQVLKVSEFAKNNAAFRSVIFKDLSEDVKLFVALGSGNLCDVVKAVATQTNTPLVLFPTRASGGGYGLASFCCFEEQLLFKPAIKPIKILVYEPFITETPLSHFGSCLGVLAGYLLHVMDLLYRYAKTSVGSVKGLNELYRRVIETLQTPTDILKTPYGKMQLFETLLQTEQRVNEFGLDFSALHATGMLVMLEKTHKLSFGHAMFLSCLGIMAIYDKFFNMPVFAPTYMLSVEKHLKAMRAFSTFSEKSFINRLLTDAPPDFSDVLSVRSVFQTMVKTNRCTLFRALKSFQQFYHDKGVFIHKIVSKEMLIQSIALCEDIYCGQTLLAQLRNAGYLDIF